MRGFAVLVALLASFGFVDSAKAFTPGGVFVLTGVLNRDLGGAGVLGCIFTMKVKGDQITDVKISRGAFNCPAFTASNLPWSISSSSPVSVTISGLTINSVIVPNCGPGTVNLYWDNTAPGRLHFNNTFLPLSCMYNGVLNAGPPQTLP